MECIKLFIPFEREYDNNYNRNDRNNFIKRDCKSCINFIIKIDGLYFFKKDILYFS